MFGFAAHSVSYDQTTTVFTDSIKYKSDETEDYKCRQYYNHYNIEAEELVEGHVYRRRPQVLAAMFHCVLDPVRHLVSRCAPIMQDGRCLRNSMTNAIVSHDVMHILQKFGGCEALDAHAHSVVALDNHIGVVFLFGEERNAQDWHGVIERLVDTASAAVTNEETGGVVAE